ncbi:winged helix-turn-helix domain-containing protein [Enterobacter hormaechei]
MKEYFLINEKVVFDSTNHKIWVEHTPSSSVTLYAPAAQCLLILVQNPGQVFSQRYLFQEVWEKNGLYSSVNTLYQNISILRRVLKSLGIDEDVIITIPRQGLKFTGQVSYVQPEQADSESMTVSSSAEKESVSDIPGSLANESDRGAATTLSMEQYILIRKYWAWLIPTILIITSFSFIVFQLKDVFSERNGISDNYHYIGDVNGCHLYSTYEGVKNNQDDFKDLVSDAGLVCSQRTTAYITMDEFNHISSVLKCDRDFRDAQADCTTHLIRRGSWK